MVEYRFKRNSEIRCWQLVFELQRKSLRYLCLVQTNTDDDYVKHMNFVVEGGCVGM